MNISRVMRRSGIVSGWRPGAAPSALSCRQGEPPVCHAFCVTCSDGFCVERAAEKSEGSFRDVRTRIDTFLTLTFTVLAVLFAGLGIIATKPTEQPTFQSPTVWVAALALFFALHAYVDARRGARRKWDSWL